MLSTCDNAVGYGIRESEIQYVYSSQGTKGSKLEYSVWISMEY